MERIKNYIKNNSWVDIILITLILLIFSFFFAKHIYSAFIDKGREFLLSEQILNGKIPFKDITMIYFPFAYYINALIFKILGVSIDSLVISQTFFAGIFIVCYYFLSREFLERNTSFLLTFLVITASVFSQCDIFNYIMPYSYASAYGYMSFVICTYVLIKLFKTDNIKFAYLASFLTGFAVSCKLEFFIALLLLFIALCLYKKINFVQFIKIFLCLCFFPLLEIAILYFQGITLSDISQGLKFAKAFATSKSMIIFLGMIGMYPLNILSKIKYMIVSFPHFINLLLLSFGGLLVYKKYNKWYILLLIFTFIAITYMYNDAVFYFWNTFPILLSVIFLIYYKDKFASDKSLVILFAATLLMCQKTFFFTNLFTYGIYSFPLLILLICVVMDKFAPEQIMELKSKHIMNFSILVLISFFLFHLGTQIAETKYPIISTKGTFYTNKVNYQAFSKINEFINTTVPEDSSLIVLPEGNMINFISGRNTNLKCFMMDRLYYDAYGGAEATEILKKSNNDYIIIIKGFNLNDFYDKYLYEGKKSLIYNYISKNYTLLKSFTFKYYSHNSTVRIYKRK